MTTKMHNKMRANTWILLAAICLSAPGILNAAEAGGGSTAEQSAREILAATGVRGGLIVHVGSGDGKLTAAVGEGPGYLVLGLETD
ncbi:MAG: hypothetical protein ABIP48_29445, partial [Planctomycetota bacterium]